MKELTEIRLQVEYDTIMKTLRRCKFNRSKAARELCIDRKTLYNKIKQWHTLNPSIEENDSSDDVEMLSDAQATLAEIRIKLWAKYGDQYTVLDMCTAFRQEMNQRVIDKWSNKVIREHFPTLIADKKEWIVKAVLAQFKSE